MIFVTPHAIRRFQERAANLPEAEVIARLSSPTIEAAARFGAQFVRLGTGHRVVIADYTVVTVLPPEHFRRQIARQGVGRYRGYSPRGEE